MEIIDTWPGTKQAKSIIEAEGVQLGRFIYVVSITQTDDKSAWIEIRSEAERKNVVGTFKQLEKKLGAKYTAIGWGWPITKNQYTDSNSGIAIDADPYGNAKVQLETSRKYADAWGQLIIYALLLPALGIWLLNTRDHGNICVWTGILMVCSGFLWVSINLVTGVQCDQDGLRIMYLFRSDRRIQWSEICGMSVIQYGQYCQIETCERGPGLPIMIPVFRYFGISNGPMLIKTIAERADLLFVEGSAPPFGVPTYKRLDLEIPENIQKLGVNQ